MIEELISNIDKFLSKKSRNLLDGRRVQSNIHQTSAFYLGNIIQDKEKLKEIVSLAEAEQDTLHGIEENLNDLKKKLKEIN